jgi:hypothetical protein
MADRRNFRDEDIETELICDTDSYEYVENTESDVDEDRYEEEEQPSLTANTTKTNY